MSPGALRQAALKIDASKLTQREAEFVQNARRLSRFSERQEPWLLAIARRQGVKVDESAVAPAPEPDRAQRRAQAPKISFRDREPDPFRAATAAAIRDMRAAGLHRRLSQDTAPAKPSVADRMRLRDAISPPPPMAVIYRYATTPTKCASVRRMDALDASDALDRTLAPVREKWSDDMDRELRDYRDGVTGKGGFEDWSTDPDFSAPGMEVWGRGDCG